ncbi:hypothetical protein ERC79_11080 [Rhodococcus sp. ABRD24]|uniref:hypothetical protein n=1 Tax=Rhodococcus sp. ABRD24 TaxID=2507582 RepID=UPI00103B0FED|nr:hypothetical protein [Rhodococcus sp. ABRD24]QBJ96439.1 hypothetical protein ERC79_11080 [Rhodococcus sp. ABRD24]
MTKDLLKTLEGMRPDTGTDSLLWPQHLQATERARIMATTTEPASPARRTRRVGTVVAVAALIAAGGVGAAAASGIMPKAFTDHYYSWKEPGPGSTPVDPAAAERIGSVPGPDSFVLSVFVARGAGDQRCMAAVFESPESAARPGPSEFTDLGGRCRQGPESAGGLGDGAGTFPVASFGDGGGGEVLPNAVTFDAAAGEAVRAEIRTSTGQVLPMVLADGSFFGWYPMPPTPGSPRPVLTGYAADGTVVGSFEIGPNF